MDVVIVTGAAGGIGSVYVQGLAKAGYAVAAADLRPPEQLVARVKAGGGTALAVAVDVSDRASTEAMAAKVHDAFGRIDGLVNNAARFTTIDPLKVTEADWDFIHRVNLKATFFCCQQGAKKMLDGNGGRIVNISSLGGIRPWSQNAHYCASKAGVIMMTRALAKAFAPKISVNSVAPGVIPFGEQDERIKRFIARTPAGRAGTADEIADAVIYFLTASNFVTGQTLAVDGGLSQQ